MSNDLNLSRQAKLIPYDEINNFNIKIFGVGSVGSHVAKNLAKAGFKNIEVYDNDIVEAENVSAQAFDFADIKKPKVEAVKEMLERAAGATPVIHNEFITDKTEIVPEANTIYCCFFDSIEARKMLFEKLKTYPIIWVDARIGQYNMRHYLVNCSKKEEVVEYEKTLETGKSSELACGEKACAPINIQITGRIVMNIINFIRGETYVKKFIGNAERPHKDIVVSEIREVEK